MRNFPIGVGGVYPAVEVAAGGRHTCVRHADGTVGCFGANARGQLGRGTTSSWSNQIQPVLGLTGVTSLDADENSTCANEIREQIEVLG